MVDANGNKYLLIKFISYFDFTNKMWFPTTPIDWKDKLKECEWSLVKKLDDFEHSFWFSCDNYEIYRFWQIQEKLKKLI